MLISNSTQINVSSEKIWNTLKSFRGVENYLPIVTKSVVEGSGQGSKRTCDVSIGNHSFQIIETLEIIDESNHTLTVFLNEGPVQIKGMKFTFVVKSQGENTSEVTINTNVENPDAASMAKSIFSMMGQGLKKLYE